MNEIEIMQCSEKNGLNQKLLSEVICATQKEILCGSQFNICLFMWKEMCADASKQGSTL